MCVCVCLKLGKKTVKRLNYKLRGRLRMCPRTFSHIHTRPLSAFSLCKNPQLYKLLLYPSPKEKKKCNFETSATLSPTLNGCWLWGGSNLAGRQSAASHRRRPHTLPVPSCCMKLKATPVVFSFLLVIFSFCRVVHLSPLPAEANQKSENALLTTVSALGCSLHSPGSSILKLCNHISLPLISIAD